MLPIYSDNSCRNWLQEGGALNWICYMCVLWIDDDAKNQKSRDKILSNIMIILHANDIGLFWRHILCFAAVRIWWRNFTFWNGKDWPAVRVWVDIQLIPVQYQIMMYNNNNNNNNTLTHSSRYCSIRAQGWRNSQGKRAFVPLYPTIGIILSAAYK